CGHGARRRVPARRSDSGALALPSPRRRESRPPAVRGGGESRGGLRAHNLDLARAAAAAGASGLALGPRFGTQVVQVLAGFGGGAAHGAPHAGGRAARRVSHGEAGLEELDHHRAHAAAQAADEADADARTKTKSKKAEDFFH